VGELRHLFGEGLRDGIACGCGASVSECDFWRRVMERAFAGEPMPSPRELVRLQDEATSSAQILRSVRRAGVREAGERYARTLGRIYAAICAESGAHVVVDGSKSPLFGVLSQEVPRTQDLDWRPLHLVRDPRAVAFSAVRRWEREGDRRRTPVRALAMMRKRLRSTGRGLLIERLWSGHASYTRVRYEDFLADPRGALSAIVAGLGDVLPEGFVASDGTVTIEPCHAVSGNRMRAQQGPLMLELDDEWRTGLRGMDRWVTDLCTFPLKRRYGYVDRASR
jgi:hypothetical protein